LSIKVPARVFGARYDTMVPSHVQAMAGEHPAGRFLYCPNGSHMAKYDNQQT